MNDKQLKELNVDIVEDGFMQKIHRSYYYQGIRLKARCGNITHSQISKMSINRVVNLIFEAGKTKRSKEIASLLRDDLEIKEGEEICYGDE